MSSRKSFTSGAGTRYNEGMEVKFSPAAPAGHRFLLGRFVSAYNNPKASEANRKALAVKIEEARTWGREKGFND